MRLWVIMHVSSNCRKGNLVPICIPSKISIKERIRGEQPDLSTCTIILSNLSQHLGCKTLHLVQFYNGSFGQSDIEIFIDCIINCKVWSAVNYKILLNLKILLAFRKTNQTNWWWSYKQMYILCDIYCNLFEEEARFSMPAHK